MKQGNYKKAYQNLCLLNETPLQAAREIYHIHAQVEVETQPYMGNHTLPSHTQASDPKNRSLLRNAGFWRRVGQLWSVKRNRRALWASFVVMISQQLCGVNVIGSSLLNTFLARSAKSDLRNSVLLFLNFQPREHE